MTAGWTGRPCPNDCGRAVRQGHLLCGACWHDVPGRLQREVHSAWSAYRKDPTDEKWFAYVEAREAALQALKARVS